MEITERIRNIEDYLKHCDIREYNEITELQYTFEKIVNLYQQLMNDNFTKKEALFHIAKIALENYADYTAEAVNPSLLEFVSTKKEKEE